MRNDNAANDDAWARVAEAVEARMHESGLTQKQAGVSPLTLRRLVKEHQPIVRREARAALCEALGWTPDSIDKILAGDEPTGLMPTESMERLEELERRFDELAQKVEALLLVLRTPLSRQ